MKTSVDAKSSHFAATDLLLWTVAGIVAFAAHAGAVVLLMQEPVDVAGSNEPPAAIMIEMAAEPEATKVDENQITPDQHDAQEVKSESLTPPPVEPPPEPVVQPQPDPEPTPPVPEKIEEPPPPVIPPVEQKPEPAPEPPPVEQQVTEELDNVAVPLPLVRPPEPKVEQKRAEKPKPVIKQRASTPPPPKAQAAAREAKAEVKQSERTAAKTTSSGLFSSSVTPAKWQAQLSAYLQRRKRYPRESQRNKEEGTVYARFQIDDRGNVLSVSITRSSGFAGLDQAILDMIREASPVPAPPPEAGKTITVPFKFNLR
ncbi:protein TonB [Agrobacterium vitis]|nr:protein TonB [Agrobacterium vitis]